MMFNTTDALDDELKRVLRNNISYDNDVSDIYVADGALYTHGYNSWDISGRTINDYDFKSLDSTGITAVRQPDGSLPNNNCYNNFLKLVSSSGLIDAGVDVGLDYNGQPRSWSI